MSTSFSMNTLGRREQNVIKENTSLSKVVDSLLQGYKLENIASSVIPKMESILQEKLKEAEEKEYVHITENINAILNKLKILSRQFDQKSISKFTKSIQSKNEEELKDVYTSKLQLHERFSKFYASEYTKVAKERKIAYYSLNTEINKQNEELEADSANAMTSIQYSQAYKDVQHEIEQKRAIRDVMGAVELKKKLKLMEKDELEEHRLRVTKLTQQKKKRLNESQKKMIASFNDFWDSIEDEIERHRSSDLNGALQQISICEAELKRRDISLDFIDEEEDQKENKNPTINLASVVTSSPIKHTVTKRREDLQKRLWVPFISDPCIPYPMEN